MPTLKVIDIVDGTSVDGPGLRTSIYFAGCPHHCPGCHNPQSWNYDCGHDMPIDDIMNHIIENDFNVTFSGGDPLAQIDNLIELAQRIKEKKKNIWCYTGYKYEEIIADNSLSRILPHIDVLVDGRYINALRDTNLLFCGSSNQRLIDVQQSLSAKSPPTLWQR